MRGLIITILFCYITNFAFTQGTQTDYLRAREVKEWQAKVYQVPQQILWSEDGTAFFYRITMPSGEAAYQLVDVLSKKKSTIDVEAIALQFSTLSETADKLSDLHTLKIQVLSVDELQFAQGDYLYSWSISKNKLTKLAKTEEDKSDKNRYSGKRADDSEGEPVISPDKKYRAFIKNHNVYISEEGKEHSEKALTFDGSPGEYYAAYMEWSADGCKLAAVKVRKADVRQLTLLESSPKDQLQPRLLNRDYVKPGDALPQYYPVIIHVESGKLVEVDKKQIDNQFSLWVTGWDMTDNAIRFEYNKRGHQEYSVFELHAEEGTTRALIKEQSSTFIHYSGKRFRKDLEGTNEVIWASERDGWNHLYLFDAGTGKVKRQITKGNWPVRSVLHVDESARHIIFEASGMKEDEDPYLIRYYSIDFDGAGLQELTPERANHKATFNKQFTYFVDVYSTVEQAPRAVLRNALTGQVQMELEVGNIDALLAEGWKAPEVFRSVGRDGQTDIWGVIIRPRNFDPEKSYPVIEYIYAGPHDSFVPKNFAANPSGMYELAELGFIVVQIDGMGTSNRSKAFHDVAWKNLKDAGFPDRIAWIKAAAQKYPYMDIERVGIYGTSAGGQSSTGALLFHPEFYKVAVSSCGCHDNRMDKIWWNEQWMGWPIGPQYAACSNIENAGNLEGKLMLIVGELDENVDPSSTYQLVDALIRQNKDHEMIMVPGMGHSSGGDFGERKRRDFFVKHLLHVDPPAWSSY